MWLNPELAESNDIECPECGDDAMIYWHPHAPNAHINCTHCGALIVDHDEDGDLTVVDTRPVLGPWLVASPDEDEPF